MMTDIEQYRYPGIFNFHQWPTHLKTIVELVLIYEELNMSTNVALWSRDVKFKDTYSWSLKTKGNFLYNQSPEGRVKKFLAEEKKEMVRILPFMHNRVENYFATKYINTITIEEILKLKHDSNLIGWSILSSIGMNLQSLSKSYEIETVKIEKIINSFINVYKQTQNFILKNQLETIIVFNGRFIHDYAVVCAAKKLNKKILYYEQGGLLKDFILIDYPVHDRKKIQNEMKEIENTLESDKKYEISKMWFFTQRQNYRFKEKSKKVNKFKKFIGLKISFFPSSEDELFSLDSNWNETVGSQIDVLKYLNEFAKRCSNNVKIVVRDHPNFKRRNKKSRKEWKRIINSLKHLEYIDHRSKISSYVIINSSDIVITHGSTIGVEAANLGKKVISTYPSFYDELNFASFPKSLDEIEYYIKKAMEKDQNAHHTYGYFMAVRGFSYKKLLQQENHRILKQLSASTFILKILNLTLSYLPQKLVKY